MNIFSHINWEGCLYKFIHPQGIFGCVDETQWIHDLNQENTFDKKDKHVE
jgi:hypothetical protein